MKITNDDFNDSLKKHYYNFRRFFEAGLVNPRPTSTTSFYKQHSTVGNIKGPNQRKPNPYRYYMMSPLRNDTKNISQLLPRKIF